MPRFKGIKRFKEIKLFFVYNGVAPFRRYFGKYERKKCLKKWDGILWGRNLSYGRGLSEVILDWDKFWQKGKEQVNHPGAKFFISIW